MRKASEFRHLKLKLDRVRTAIDDIGSRKTLSPKLHESYETISSICTSSDDILQRRLLIGGHTPGILLYLSGLIDHERLESNLLNPLQSSKNIPSTPPTVDEIVSSSHIYRYHVLNDYRQVAQQIMSGQVILLIEGIPEAIGFELRKRPKRALAEPQTEVVIRGPHESFIEDLSTNINLVRARLKDPQLHVKEMTIGKRTQSRVAVLYIADIAKLSLVNEVLERLNRIDIDGILESAYIEEYIEDNPGSVFPQTLYTERPDSVTGHLLEGRVAVFTEGTPIALIMPITFFGLMQSVEDYYERFWISSALRILRFVFLIVALLLPSLYVAITTFHQEMLPTSLIFRIAASREQVPFPAFLEALLMEIFFEILREASIRMPKGVAQALNIVGALVIGQAVVQAGIVSAPMVLIVALTGISSFAIPHFNLAIAIRILRFPMMFLAGFLGLYGIMLGLLGIFAHLASLRSFGVAYLSPFAPMDTPGMPDSFVRIPHWMKRNRPATLETMDEKRIGATRKLEPSKTAKLSSSKSGGP